MEQKYKYMVCVRCFTYNHAKYITETMDGFAKQETTFPVVNLIVDDASTDGEQDVILQYLKENIQTPIKKEETSDYQLLCGVHKMNLKCSFVVFLLKYNHYGKKSKLSYLTPWINSSKYYALCEGDDYWLDANKLQTQVSFLESHSSYAMCHTAIKYYLEEEKKYLESKDISINNSIINEGLTPEKILLGYRIQYCTVLCRQEAFVKARESDPFLFSGNFKMGDTQLWYQLYKEGGIYFLPQVCAVYRKHTGSATRAAKVYDKLVFSLSSAELRMYLAQRDDLSQDFCNKVKQWYSKSFIKCLAFNRNLIAKYPIDINASRFLFVLNKVHLLKPCLFVYMRFDPWLSRVKQWLTGKM